MHDRQSRLLAVLILCGLALATGVMGLFKHELVHDRDAYLQLAESVAAGNGLAYPGTHTPTAYRPPLYPVLLGLVRSTGLSVELSVALVNLFALCVIYTLTAACWRLGTSHESSMQRNQRWSWFVMLVVLLDPLLLNYAAQPMTEILSACWTMVILYLLWTTLHDEFGVTLVSWIRAGSLALACSLAALTRPTFLMMTLGILVWLMVGFLSGAWKIPAKKRLKTGLLVLFMVMIFLCPLWLWALRNQSHELGLVCTTTHGGYTLYLANNEPFYKTVVDRHPMSVWELPEDHPDSQQVWWNKLEQEMDQQGILTENTRDQYLGREAQHFIKQQPRRFLKACLYRIFWFWSPVPLAGQSPLPKLVIWGVAAFYLWENLACFVGMILVLIRRELWTFWGLCMVMVLAYEVLHLFYWTNARMRAPVIPLIALLATRTTLLLVTPRDKSP